MTAEKAIFVPLKNVPFYWFRDGLKTWELRRATRQFAPKHIRIGRAIVLSRGHSTPDRLYGRVVGVEIADTIEAIFCFVPFKKIIPTAANIEDAVKHAKAMLGPKPGPFIAIKPCLNTSDQGSEDDE